MVVQGDLPKPLAKGESVRVRVEESYVDPVGYKMDGKELVWTRTVSAVPVNFVIAAGRLDAGRVATASPAAAMTLDSKAA